MRFYFGLIFLIIFSFSHTLYAQTCDTLRVAGSNKWLPIAFTPYLDEKSDSHQAKGIAYDLSRYIAKQLNLPIDINTNIPWAKAMRDLEQGDIDFIAGVYSTQERKAQFLMTPAFSQDTLNLYVKKGYEFSFQRLDDLIDKKVDIRRRSSNGQAFDAFAKKHLKPELINIVDTYEQLFLRLERGRTDYVILDTYTGNQILKKLGLEKKISMLEQPLVTNPIHLMMSKRSPCANHFNKIVNIIQQAQQNGKLKNIHQAYY
jgi:polar amino acid transport system substrate-binding protein